MGVPGARELAAPTVWTVGHSTRSLEEFLEILRAHEVERIVDVRRYPGSKRYPHFSSEPLALSLADAGLSYRHAPDLGGRRTPSKNSRHTAWRSASFRAYADHMETPQFQNELQHLIDDTATLRQAIMCAEAVPWRCHRQLISDALVARGLIVLHILSTDRADRHELSEHAQLTPGGGVQYVAGAVNGQTGLGLG